MYRAPKMVDSTYAQFSNEW